MLMDFDERPTSKWQCAADCVSAASLALLSETIP